MKRRDFLIASSFGAVLPYLGQAAASSEASRVALVIGNSKYPLSPLSNPIPDARSISAALKAIGFEILEYEDATRADMLQGLEAIASKLAGNGSVAMLYFAGHGVQVEWRNYLIPVDAPLQAIPAAIQQSVPLDTFLTEFRKSKAAMNIVILDACRSNPLQGSQAAIGLAGLDAPSDTFLAYATAPGNDADDGSNGHGLYTAALLEEIARPNVKIEDVFKRVRLRVRLASQGRQIPWENSSLESDFYFSRTDGGGQEPATDEKQFDIELATWKKAEAENTADAWASYLSQFPHGFFTRAAQFRLDHIAEPLAVAQPSPFATKSIVRGLLPAGAPRFEVGDKFVWRQTDDYTSLSHDFRSNVTAIEGGKVIFGTGRTVSDLLGNEYSNGFAVYDPIQCFVPPDLAAGKKWSTAFRTIERNSQNSQPKITSYYEQWSLVVASREIVVIQAGSFDSFRVDATGYSANSSVVASFWFEAKSLLKIKSVHRVHTSPRTPGLGNDRFTIELVSGPERFFSVSPNSPS